MFRGEISEEVCKYLIHQSLKGLYALHKRDMIHRDIKSDNILVNKSGILKICDFGLSAQMIRETPERRTEIGTPHWTAPEIIDSQPYGQKVDVWSFGIFTYVLAEGQPPFMDKAQHDVNFHILNSKIPNISNKYSEDFSHFIQCCLQKNPALRISTKDLLQHKFLLNADHY